MIDRLRRLAAPPVLADEDQSRIANILNFTLLVVLAGVVVYAVVTPLFMRERLSRLPLTIAAFFLLLGLMRLLRLGYVRLTAYVLTISLWLALVYVSLNLPRQNSPAFSLQILVVIVAALTLGAREEVAFAVLTILFGVGLYFADQAGLLPPPSLAITPLANIAIRLIALLVSVVLLHRAAGQLQAALDQSRRSERALAEHNQRLELEIAERRRVEAELRESQARLTETQVIGHIGTWDSDLLTGEQIWSDETYHHLGLKPGEVTPSLDLFLSRVHPDDRRLIERLTDPALITGGSALVQYRVVHPSGDVRYLTSRSGVQYDAEGNPARIVGITQDITPQKQAELALQEREEVLRLATDAGKIGIWDWNAYTDEVQWSEHTYEIFGLTPETFGRTVHDFRARIYPDDLPRVRSLTSRIDANGRIDIGDFRIVMPDGSIRWVYEQGKIYYDASGKTARVIGTVQDITERKQAEQQQFDLAVERERVALLKEFIGNVSHDLKTPLSVLNTSLYLLERMNDPDQQLARIDTMKQQVLLLERLIQDILTMSYLDHTPELTLGQVDLNDLLRETEAGLRPASERKQLTIKQELDDSLPPILANGEELSRVMVNLLENAIKYTPEAGVVTIRTRRQDQNAITEIADTGIGISADELPQIFKRFFRADQARSLDTLGTGLGLSIVQRIVEMHNGSIEVSSQPGQGSTFRVILPLAG